MATSLGTNAVVVTGVHGISFRSAGMKLHVSNSGAIINGVGTDLDFVRPGISMYGQPPGINNQGTKLLVDLQNFCFLIRYAILLRTFILCVRLMYSVKKWPRR